MLCEECVNCVAMKQRNGENVWWTYHCRLINREPSRSGLLECTAFEKRIDAYSTISKTTMTTSGPAAAVKNGKDPFADGEGREVSYLLQGPAADPLKAGEGCKITTPKEDIPRDTFRATQRRRGRPRKRG